MKNEQNNVISLVDYIENKKSVEAVIEQSNYVAKMAPISKRVMSFVIDVGCIINIKLLMNLAYMTFVQEFLFTLNNKTQTSLVNGVTVFDWSLTMIIFISYFTIANYIGNGKTIGARVMKLSLIDNNYLNDLSNEFQPTLPQSFRRAMSYFISYLSFGTLFGIALLTKDKRGFPDIISKTSILTDDEFHQVFLHKSKLESFEMILLSFEDAA